MIVGQIFVFILNFYFHAA